MSTRDGFAEEHAGGGRISQIRILTMFLLIWFALSLCIVPLYAFQDTEAVQNFLEASRFDSFYVRAFATAYPADIAYFLSLYLPRLLFAVALIGLLRKYRLWGEVLAPSRGLLVSSMGVAAVSSLVGYEPALFCGLYLGAYVLGRMSRGTAQAILIIGCIVVAIYLFDVGRGASISVVAIFLIGRARFDRSSFLLIVGALVTTIILTTLLKFGSSDGIMANPFDRLSVFNQFKIYLWGNADTFSAGRPVTIDLIASMPLIRNFIGQLSENALFDMFTGGSLGGLAVSPEIRGQGFWNGQYWVYLDLALTYGLIWLVLRTVVLKVTGGFDIVTIITPSLIQFDSMNVAAAAVQVILISIVLIVIDRHLSRGSQPATAAGVSGRI